MLKENKMFIGLFTVFISSIFFVGCPQTSNEDVELVKITAKNPYLGETPPGDDPKIFAPGIVSTQEFFEIGLVFSSDGKEIYFSRSDGPDIRGIFSIWFCREGDDGWSSPEKIYFSVRDDFASFIMPDGKRFLFFSHDNSDPDYRNGTYITERVGDSWSPPEFYNKAYCLTSALNGNMYYSSKHREETSRDIITFREVNGEFTEPQDLIGGVNTEYYDAHSYIAPDDSYILFDSERPERQSPTVIYVSFRNVDGTWSEAYNLGEKINGIHSHMASLSPDGEYIFFTRENDIWWVSANIIKQKKKEWGMSMRKLLP